MGKIVVEAREIMDIDAKSVNYFIRVSVQEEHISGNAILDEEDIDEIIPAINKLIPATINTKRFQFTEIEYERSGLKIIIFNTAKGQIMSSVSTQGASVHMSSVRRLEELRDMLMKAKRIIADNKPMR